MSEKVFKLFGGCFFAFFTLVWVGSALYGWYFLEVDVFSVLALAAVMGMIYWLSGQIKSFAPLWIALLGLLPRTLLLGVVGREITQVSDFGAAMEAAQMLPQLGDYFRVFSTWIAHVYYLSLVPSVFFGVCLNGGYAVLSGVLLYWLVLQAGFERRTAVMAALVFLWQPSFLLYTTVLSPEFLHVALGLLAMNLFLLGRKWAGWYPLSGLVLCLSGLLRNVAVIYLIACAIVLLMKWHKRTATGLLVAAVCYLAAMVGFYGAVAHFSGQTIDKSPMAHFLYVGLTDGVWTPETSKYFDYVKESGFDFEQASARLMKELVQERSQGQWLSFWELFVKKTAVCWGNDDYVSFTQNTLSPQAKEKAQLARFFPYIHGYYLVVLLGVVLSALKNKKINMVFFAQVSLVGFTLLMLLSEVQPRYKMVLYPLMAFCGAAAMQALRDNPPRLFRR